MAEQKRLIFDHYIKILMISHFILNIKTVTVTNKWISYREHLYDKMWHKIKLIWRKSKTIECFQLEYFIYENRIETCVRLLLPIISRNKSTHLCNLNCPFMFVVYMWIGDRFVSTCMCIDLKTYYLCYDQSAFERCA